jgi:hypothetical protein
MPARRSQREHVSRLLLLLAPMAFAAPIAMSGVGAASIDSPPASVSSTSPALPVAPRDDPRIDGTISLGHCTITTLQDELRNLDDADPAIRARTRELLMSLPPSELPALRDAVRQLVGQAGPLSPTQISLLRDVVCQIASIPVPEPADGPAAPPQLAPLPAAPMPGAPLPKPAGGGGMAQGLAPSPNNAFLGILLGSDDDLEPNIGATVQQRMPGFIGYRMLHDGDVIDSILVPGVDSAPRMLATLGNLQDAIGQLRPGDIVVLGVVRGGRHLQITLALDAKTAELGRDGNIVRVSSVPDFIQQQLEKAQVTWDQQFAPLVGDVEPASSSARAD